MTEQERRLERATKYAASYLDDERPAFIDGFLQAAECYSGSKKPEFITLSPPERRRTYFYADGTAINLRDVTGICVSDSGTHRINTLDGKKHIIPTGWRRIELDVDKWTF